jgi:hypothetical protein
MKRFLLLLTLAAEASHGAESAAAQPASPPLVGASAGFGVGSGYSLVGFQLQVRLGSFAAFAAVTPPPWKSVGQCNNERARGGDRGLYLGGNLLAYHACVTGASQAQLVSITLYSVLAGWRFRFGPLYIDLAAGPALAHQKNECTYCQQRFLSSSTTFGAPSPSAFAVDYPTLPWGNFEGGLGLAF